MWKFNIDWRDVKSEVSSVYFLLFVMAIIYIVIVSRVAITGHYAFSTNAWDLGIFSQALYSTINHGEILYYTAELPGNPSGSLFGIHFSPFLFLLVPIYALYQNPVTLLILKPVAISIGLIPLYWIIREQKFNSKVLPLLLGIVYLVYPPIMGGVLNFDLQVFLPALFLFALYYLKGERLIHSYVFVVLALMVNEFVSFIVMMMAVYFFLLHRKEIINGLKSGKMTRKCIFAVVLLLTGILWVSLATEVISRFNPHALSTKWEWGELGSSPGEIMVNVVTNPLRTLKMLFNDGVKKGIYLIHLFGPLDFLSFLDPLTLIMTMPWLIASFLSINPLYYTIGNQYPAFVSPFIFISAINGIKKLVNKGGDKTLRKVILVISITLCLTALLVPPGEQFQIKEVEGSIQTAVDIIPRDSSASVMPEVFPHLCNNLEVYPYFKDGVEYVLVDVYSWWYTATLPEPAHTAPRWCDAVIGEEYGLMFNANGVLLYKEGYEGSLEHFEGIDFKYTSHNVESKRGKVYREEVPLQGSWVETDVLVHERENPRSLFFEGSKEVFPPGRYNVSMMLKISHLVPTEVLTLSIMTEPERCEILSTEINGTFFENVGEWQRFNFEFSIEEPTFTKILVYGVGVTDVYFYSVNLQQISGKVGS